MSLLAHLAIACASCGSGGDSPLILYPNEPWKLYLGYSRQSDIHSVTESGDVVEELGPERKATLTAAVGATLATDVFATVTVPYVTNERDDRERSGVGDPAASLHWTVVPQSLLQPAVPQVQAFASYKRALARSPYEGEDENWLDVFGNGFDEGRVGVDAWWGQERIKGGAAAVLAMPRAREVAGARRQPGLGTRATATVGAQLIERSKIVVGATREERRERRVDGEAIPGSEERNHLLFGTIDYKYSDDDVVRLTLQRSAAFGSNMNVTRATAVTLALMVVP